MGEVEGGDDPAQAPLYGTRIELEGADVGAKIDGLELRLVRFKPQLGREHAVLVAHCIRLPGGPVFLRREAKLGFTGPAPLAGDGRLDRNPLPDHLAQQIEAGDRGGRVRGVARIGPHRKVQEQRFGSQFALDDRRCARRLNLHHNLRCLRPRCEVPAPAGGQRRDNGEAQHAEPRAPGAEPFEPLRRRPAQCAEHRFRYARRPCLVFHCETSAPSI